MKKILLSLCLFVLVVNPVFSQNDSSYWSNVAVKINPTLMVTSVIQFEGEFGAMVELPIKIFHKAKDGKRINLLIGGGYNREFDEQSLNVPRPDGVGYTIRAGLDYYFNKEEIVSLVGFYRKWTINGVIDYGTSSSPSTLDPVLDIPSGSIFDFVGVGNDESPPPTYQDNATANAGALDLIYTRRWFIDRRVAFEWYAGMGIRYKTIEYERIGSYAFPSQYNVQNYPFPYSGYYTSYSEPKFYLSTATSSFDLKAGIIVDIFL